MPQNLLNLPVGRAARITEVADQSLHTRMQAMGIREGAEIVVLSKGASSSRLLRVGDARVSVAKQLCELVRVEPLASDPNGAADVL